MTTVTTTSKLETQFITTTLLDLMNAMQESAITPAQDAQIVPTVVHWIRSGRLSVADDVARQSAA